MWSFYMSYQTKLSLSLRVAINIFPKAKTEGSSQVPPEVKHQRTFKGRPKRASTEVSKICPWSFVHTKLLWVSQYPFWKGSFYVLF